MSEMRNRGGSTASASGSGGMGSKIVNALAPEAMQRLARKWFRVLLSSLAALFAIIGLASNGWASAKYPPGVAAQEEVSIGLRSGLPTVRANYSSGVVDDFATSECYRVGTVALGFGILGLLLVVAAALAQFMKATGRTFDESYFVILSCSFIASLCFFCGAILYGQSIPTFGDSQRLGWSLGIYVVAGCFSFISAAIGFRDT